MTNEQASIAILNHLDFWQEGYPIASLNSWANSVGIPTSQLLWCMIDQSQAGLVSHYHVGEQPMIRINAAGKNEIRSSARNS